MFRHLHIHVLTYHVKTILWLALLQHSISSFLSSVAFISSSFTSRRSDTGTTYCPQILNCSSSIKLYMIKSF